MGTLYLDRKDIELRREGRHLCLYEAGSRSATIPLNVVERVVIRGQATLSTGVLGLLAEEGVGLLVLAGRQGRAAAILHGKNMATPRGASRNTVGTMTMSFGCPGRAGWWRSN